MKLKMLPGLVYWWEWYTEDGNNIIWFLRKQYDYISVFCSSVWIYKYLKKSSSHIFFFLIFSWPCVSIYLFININQLDALNFIINLFQASTCFEHHVPIVRRANCIIQHLVSSHSVGGSPVHSPLSVCAPDGHLQVWWYQMLYNTIWPPNDKHMCSKHVEAWNKFIIKFSASSWLILTVWHLTTHMWVVPHR